MSGLASKDCVPCRGGVPPLPEGELKRLKQELQSAWVIEENHHLARDFIFPDFKKALEFTNRVGALAEREGHHPDFELSWGRVRLKIWTHAINGLTESDFILAAKIDELHLGQKS